MADDLYDKKSLGKVALNTAYTRSGELISLLAKVGWWSGIWEAPDTGLY